MHFGVRPIDAGLYSLPELMQYLDALEEMAAEARRK